ncbi:acetyltransferase [Loktanella sp. 3ANDIMAR09]|uniref:GNAT family N-acetyltransferase n=1 Tax=Loktanella sp. 3ANDIMAR09 TaxID=1225657 RepID=UPI0006FCC3DA|nr:GNAT family N-acetyltransferase [Loktanella sp. 3ANDIMAR09]KQI68889.1 acetyltransferase [Loktanella sp. 3ANDIMAR09]
MQIELRRVAVRDRAAWEALYRGYAAFYAVDQTPDMRDRVWNWLMDDAHEVAGHVAVCSDGQLCGLAHVRPFARPLAASTGLFLDDLFVDSTARGQGVADALILHLADLARAQGHSVLRWITADDNARARRVYDRHARKIDFATYDLAL